MANVVAPLATSTIRKYVLFLFKARRVAVRVDEIPHWFARAFSVNPNIDPRGEISSVQLLPDRKYMWLLEDKTFIDYLENRYATPEGRNEGMFEHWMAFVDDMRDWTFAICDRPNPNDRNYEAGLIARVDARS